MNNCKECNELLIEGKNWWASSKKCSSFFCNTCSKKRNKTRYENNKESHFQKHKEWKANNREQWLDIVKKSNAKRKDKRQDQNKQLYKSLGSGIYGFKYKDKWIYVGESVTIYRRWKDHLSGSIKRSPISQLILEGKIDRDELEFEVLENVNDKQQRFKRETYWINHLNPILNKSKVDVISRL